MKLKLPETVRLANEANRLERAPAIVAANGTTEMQRTKGVGGWWYVLALLLPIAGVIAGIYWLAKNEVGPGLALFATSFVGWMAGLVLLFGM